MNGTKRTVNVLVYDRPNVLIKLISFFEKRGFRIENINLIETDKPGISKYNIVISGEDNNISKSSKQLYKVIETIDVNIS